MYRVVDTRFWTDDKVRALRPMARYVFAYLITGPESNMTGVYRYQPETFIADLGIDRRTYFKAQKCLETAGLLSIFPNERLLWITNMFKYQGTTSPKVLKYVRTYLNSLPPSPLIASFYMAYPYVLGPDPKDLEQPNTVSLIHRDTVGHTVSTQYQYQKYKVLSTCATHIKNAEPDPAADDTFAASREEPEDDLPDPPNVLAFPKRDRPLWEPIESFGQIMARLARNGRTE